jgi:Peptidase_C39 like family
MPTAARGATLIILGALLAQAPLTAAAYEPHDRTTSATPTTQVPAAEPTATEPTSEPTTGPTVTPTPIETPSETPSKPVAEPPAARSWSEVVQQVTETSPDDQELRAADNSAQASSVMRCFKLEEENYCLGLGFVDQAPSGAQVQDLLSPPSMRADDEVGVEQDIPTGDLTPAAFVAERSSMPKGARVNAELDEMQAAWDGRDKARALRLLNAAEGTPTPVKLPTSSYIMKGFQTSQEKGYWCGPATFQSIDWADDKQRDTQGSWAKDLGTTTSGTAISAMVKQTNLKTNWDLAAGTYIVQNVGHWNAQKFFTVHQNHLGDGQPAPIIEHTQLLKRYFPYLAFNHSGHYQVGRGYDRAKGTIAIYEVFNERRFNSRGNVTDGPKNIPATALFNATLANSFKNIGL